MPNVVQIPGQILRSVGSSPCAGGFLLGQLEQMNHELVVVVAAVMFRRRTRKKTRPTVDGCGTILGSDTDCWMADADGGGGGASERYSWVSMDAIAVELG